MKAPRTDTFGRSAVRRGREGGSGHGPSPRDPPAKRRPVGSTWRLRAHTRETASPFPWGGGGPSRKWSRRSASPPIPCPWEGNRLRVGRGCMHVVRTRGQGEETKRRAAAMMLSRRGWDKTPLPVACQTVEGRRAPWGCAAGAPYRGTASPPPPPPQDGCVCMCVCVCVCVCVYGLCVYLVWCSSHPHPPHTHRRTPTPITKKTVLHPPPTHKDTHTPMYKHTHTLNESKQPPTRPIPTHCPPTHPHTYLDSGCVTVKCLGG